MVVSIVVVMFIGFITFPELAEKQRMGKQLALVCISIGMSIGYALLLWRNRASSITFGVSEWLAIPIMLYVMIRGNGYNLWADEKA